MKRPRVHTALWYFTEENFRQRMFRRWLLCGRALAAKEQLLAGEIGASQFILEGAEWMVYLKYLEWLEEQ